MNDNESDYLIKTEIKYENVNDAGNFIISPPLLIVKKNQSNLISIIPNNVKYNHDKVFDLVVTAIPKIDLNTGNSVDLAVRSHFKLIYRHKAINEKILENLVVKSYSSHERLLINPTQSFITFTLSCENNDKFRFNIKPNKSVLVPNCTNAKIAFVQDDGAISSAKSIDLV